MAEIRVGILVFDGCQETGLTAPLDVFRTAEAVARAQGSSVTFTTTFLSMSGGPCVSAGGLQVLTSAADHARVDAVVIPGIHHRDAEDLLDSVSRLGAEAAWIRRLGAAQVPVLASCSGVFLLGAAGILEGRSATTSWWLSALLHKCFPAMRLAADGRTIVDGPCVSAAGVTSYYDLALWLVRRFAGEDLSNVCAKFLLLDLDRQTQTPFVIDHLVLKPREDLIEKARDWLNTRMTQTLSIEDLARYCGVSQRTLLRRFRDATGGTPARYLQNLRLARAKALLEDTALTAAEIASRCGYADVATFRKIFKLRILLTPRQYRVRFGRKSAEVLSVQL